MGRFKLGQKPSDAVANALNPEHNLITNKGTVANPPNWQTSMMNVNSPEYQATLNKETPQPVNPTSNPIEGVSNIKASIDSYKSETAKEKARWNALTSDQQKQELEKKAAQNRTTEREQYLKNFYSGYGGITTGAANLAITEGGQQILNFLPVTGEIIDAKNTAVDLNKGDYLGAAANAAGLMIPFVPGGVVKGALKTGLKKLENAFYPNTVYRSQVVGKNRINYKNASTPQAVKVNEKGNFYTSNFDDAEFYARGDFKHTSGIKQGDDVVMSQAKLPFWMKPTTKDKDVINLKKLTNDAPSPDEYLVPSGGFSSMFVKKKDFAIKGMPEHIKNTKEAQMFIGNRPIQREGNPYYNTEGGKYVLDQFEGAKSYFKNK